MRTVYLHDPGEVYFQNGQWWVALDENRNEWHHVSPDGSFEQHGYSGGPCGRQIGFLEAWTRKAIFALFGYRIIP